MREELSTLFETKLDVKQSRNVLREHILMSDYIQHTLGEDTTATNRIKCPNPEHSDKTPSFFFDDSKGKCNCFGCDLGGDVVNLHATVFQMTTIQAIRELADTYDIDLELYTERKVEKETRFDNFKRLRHNTKHLDETEKIYMIMRDANAIAKKKCISQTEMKHKLNQLRFLGSCEKRTALVNQLYNEKG